MLLVVAVVIFGIGVYACADFGTPSGAREARAPFTYWLLLMAVWGSLNLVFVSGDLFTLYVALELLTFAGVPLVSLEGRGETLRAALRYLLFALLGSVLYLLGAVLLYGAYGTLDIALLAAGIGPDPATVAAAALMTTGLLAKTALFRCTSGCHPRTPARRRRRVRCCPHWWSRVRGSSSSACGST